MNPSPLFPIRPLRCFLSALFLFLAAAAILPADDQKPIVVVISLDGFPAYALDDPRLPCPTLRRIAREGTYAAAMRPINPTITWPNHTAMVTGVDASQHFVLFNGLLERPAPDAPPVIEPWRDKDKMVHAQTIYDVAHHAGLTTAQVDWVAIYNARNIDWKFPEDPDPSGEMERALIADGTLTVEQLQTFGHSSQVWRDEIWLDAAQKILIDHRPNLLLLHFLTLDSINHQYAPMSEASFAAMALLDNCVKRIFDLLQRPPFAGRATLLIVSDHGFRAIDHQIHANVLLQQNSLIHTTGGATKADAWVIADGGVALLFILNPARKSQLLPVLRQLYADAEGIDHVYAPEEFPKLGLPTPDHTDQSPDLLLAAKPGYAFTNEPATQLVSATHAGAHGYLNSDPDMRSIFLAWGPGIPQATRLNEISVLDVAPTIASLLHISLPAAHGHSLAH